jgi:hypothetical protein
MTAGEAAEKKGGFCHRRKHCEEVARQAMFESRGHLPVTLTLVLIETSVAFTTPSGKFMSNWRWRYKRLYGVASASAGRRGRT